MSKTVKNRGNGIGTAGFIIIILAVVFFWIPPVSFILQILGFIFCVLGLLFGILGGRSITLSIIGILIVTLFALFSRLKRI